ncbi:hypothetical protein MKX72_07310 [Priestia sp. FSL R5-0597]|uniref:hypothetical protein n=1 Tax=Priestia TaxID=2800373 RepID=UPI001649FA80|nr:hypothetical protein [Priestia megaterium]
MAYSEADKMLLASFIMMDVSALQAENDMCKSEGKSPKYGEKDFFDAVRYAEKRLREY